MTYSCQLVHSLYLLLLLISKKSGICKGTVNRTTDSRSSCRTLLEGWQTSLYHLHHFTMSDHLMSVHDMLNCHLPFPCKNVQYRQQSCDLCEGVPVDRELMQSRLSCQAFVGPYHVHIVCWLHSQNKYYLARVGQYLTPYPASRSLSETFATSYLSLL